MSDSLHPAIRLANARRRAGQVANDLAETLKAFKAGRLPKGAVLVRLGTHEGELKEALSAMDPVIEELR